MKKVNWRTRKLAKTRPMYSVFVSLIGLAFASNAAIATAEPHRRVLSGQEIRKVFVDKITTDGAHFAYHLKSNGKVIGVMMGRSREGTWAIRNDQLCLSVPTDAPADCWKVERLSGSKAFRLDDVDVTVERPTSKYDFFQ